jgi:hypothetical protein
MPLEIQCNTTETGIRMEWEKDGKNITVPDDSRIKITDNKLVIEGPQIGDAGNYSCRIYKHDAKTGEKNILVIGKPTDSLAFTKFCLLFCCSFYYYYYYYYHCYLLHAGYLYIYF